MDKKLLCNFTKKQSWNKNLARIVLSFQIRIRKVVVTRSNFNARALFLSKENSRKHLEESIGS